MHLLAILFSCFFVFLTALAVPTNVGYSGAPGRGTCASTCHGSAGGTVAISGFPTEYIPDSTYVITIQRLSGQAIKNFNGSIRRQANNQNAGVISGGQGTSTYSVAGETNGIHLSTFDQVSATFNWHAPAAGAGNVRLYIGAHQGSQPGPNTTIQATATETILPQPPEPATNPEPANGAVDVAISELTLSWTPGDGTITQDVYFGINEPLELVSDNQGGTTYVITGPLELGTVYSWRIDSGNDAGVTPGTTWSFMTGNIPEPASNLFPLDSATDVIEPLEIEWTASATADFYNVCFGTENPPPMLAEHITANLLDVSAQVEPGVTYYWGIAAVNEFGTTPSPIWSFTMQADAANEPSTLLPAEVTLGPSYPNPFNAEVTIPFALPSASHTRIEIYDLTGRRVALVADQLLNAGTHQLRWNSGTFGSGVYFISLSAAGVSHTEKIVALK